MSPPAAQELGHYTSAELRGSGVSVIGFLQPLFARPVGAGGDGGEKEAAEGLVRRGLRAGPGPSGQALGDLAATLEAIAAAWAFAGCAFQQRLQMVSTQGTRWLVLGARRGPDVSWRSAAPAGPGRVRSAIRAILAGDPVLL
jgi:hypothetical protein